ncbi:FkbM family methyltransferase [Aeromicrobium sp. 50.2.37]|uniref:FkbM family methyltransferase n=1 Tax=Aeromicrobium sp. 50.2.37 TaxID=2969305 RepID=UPI0021501BF5|nr:FkbM family methyltransferase [Aeromicrobium sp. 50.2.37]MCR4514739.1 FkbM family methyltransferase [Aeromicrobium sp. 50.2.37]
MALRGLGYTTRRVRQSFTHFRNGPQLLAAMARGGEVTFRTRSGLTIHTPNSPGARFPVYEITADDVYRVDELVAGLRPDFVAVDVGAHIGSFSTAVCSRAPGATVHAYEASPSTAVWTRRNADANGFSERLHVHAEAVSDHRGTLRFVDNGEASAHNGLTAPDGLGTEVEVPCVTFADVHAAAGGRIDLLKSDAEGAEYGYILGSDPALWTDVQRVVMEYHPVPGHDLGDLTRFLGDVGLTLVRDEPSTDKPGLGNAWFSRVA